MEFVHLPTIITKCRDSYKKLKIVKLFIKNMYLKNKSSFYSTITNDFSFSSF